MNDTAFSLEERTRQQGNFLSVKGAKYPGKVVISRAKRNPLYDESADESKFAPTRSDGGPGSGNHGHKGVPGQVGGSAPSSKSLSESVNAAFSTGDEDEVMSAVKKAMSSMPVGGSFEFADTVISRISESEFETTDPWGEKHPTTIQDTAESIAYWEDDYPEITFKDPDTKGTTATSGTKKEQPKSSEARGTPTEATAISQKNAEARASAEDVKGELSERLVSTIADGDYDGVAEALNSAPIGANLVVGSGGEVQNIVKTGDGTFCVVDKFWNVTRSEQGAGELAEVLCDTVEDPDAIVADVKNVSVGGHRIQNSNPYADETTGSGLCEKKVEGSKVDSFQRLSDSEKEQFILASSSDVSVDPEFYNANSDTQRLSEALNNNGKPSVISKEEFEEARRSGERVVYRAVNTQEAVDSLMRGDATYHGDGIKGDGIYMSDDREHILDRSGFGAKKMGITFKKGATIKSAAELSDEMAGDSFFSKFVEDHAFDGFGSFGMSEYCLMKGYDGFYFENKEGENYYCMVKRDNLQVCEL